MLRCGAKLIKKKHYCSFCSKKTEKHTVTARLEQTAGGHA
jgi:hypothetical protein